MVRKFPTGQRNQIDSKICDGGRIKLARGIAGRLDYFD
jgi:hypothetical protein